MKYLVNRLLEAFSDGQYLSATRLITICWCIGVLGVWIIGCLYSYFALHLVVLIPIPPSILAFLLSLLGTKLVSHHIETRNDGTPDEDPETVAAPAVVAPTKTT